MAESIYNVDYHKVCRVQVPIHTRKQGRGADPSNANGGRGPRASGEVTSSQVLIQPFDVTIPSPDAH